MTSPKLTLFFGFVRSKLSLLYSKLGSQAVPMCFPSWSSCCCWIKLPKLNPIAIVLWPKLPKLRFASCWSKLRELDSTSRIGLKLPTLASSRSGSDSGLSLSRSKLFKLDSRLLSLLLSLLLLLFGGMVVGVVGDVVVVVVCVVVMVVVVVVVLCTCISKLCIQAVVSQLAI